MGRYRESGRNTFRQDALVPSRPWPPNPIADNVFRRERQRPKGAVRIFTIVLERARRRTWDGDYILRAVTSDVTR